MVSAPLYGVFAVWFQNRRARSNKRKKGPSNRTLQRCNNILTAPKIHSNQKQTTARQSPACHQSPTQGSFLNCYPVVSYPSLYPHFLPGPSHAMHLEVKHQNHTQFSVQHPSYYGNNHFLGVESTSQILANQSSPKMNNRRLNLAGPFYADLYYSQDTCDASITVSSTPESTSKLELSLPNRFETASPLPELSKKSENTRLETPNSNHSFSPSSLEASGDWSRLNDTPESTGSDNNVALKDSNNGKNNDTEENTSTTGNSDSGIGQDVGD
ncbi:hypothetical protein CHS0354_033053 [Potamilus streckersoni]|uniref:Homeobox domain-containing protein n=1 Tax=Potamilus streckersoni TaxID=2493646 RepID=A0AAE0RXC3_9BIVA|nr:hypothetical protein CHS0354_033053 [Potamilus streckersoni]